MDGWIIIATKIDNTQFEKDAKELEKKTDEIGDKLSEGISQANTEAQNIDFKNAQKGAENLGNEVDAVTGTMTGAISKLGLMSGETAEIIINIGQMATQLGAAVTTVLPVLAIITAIIIAINALVTALKEFAEKVKNTFVNIIKAIMIPTLEALKTVFKNLADIIRNQVNKAFDTLKQKAREGVSNLAEISTRLKESLTSLDNSLTAAGNAIASAFAPIIESAIPLLNDLLAAITNVANGIAQITGSLFGNATTFKRAKNTSDEYAKSLGKVTKEAKGALASFDEINVLAKQSNGRASSNGLLQDMFEEVAISPQILDFTSRLKELWNADDIEGLEVFGKELGEKAKAQLQQLPTYEWARIIGTKITNALSLVNGFLSENPRRSVGN